MPKFSKRSLDKLNTVHPDLRKVYFELIKIMDITILEGIRSFETQEEYVRTGKSKTLKSKHLEQSDGYSHAVDAVPYPIDWGDKDRFIYMQGMIRGIASQMGIKVRSGIDWDSDGEISDHSFFDGPHCELIA